MTKHPELAKKLQTLYSLRVNPEIQSNVDLAGQLSVSKQAVSRWCCGTSTQRGNSVPDQKLVPLADVFDIEPYWFSYGLEEFADCVKTKLTAEKSGPVDKVQHVSIASLPITGLDIFGRDEEITKLNNWWQNGRTNIVQIVAFGGVGKSALVNKWLSVISKDHYRYANRVYAWSFYWQGHSSDIKSSGDFFIENALEWFGDENPTKGTPWAKASRLANLIRSYRTLLVLDGLEPLQSPSNHRLGELENSAISLLLKELAADNTGLCVLTSRISIRDLEPFNDGRVETIFLDSLSTQGSIKLLERNGVAGDRSIFEKVTDYYSGHPLSLILLSGYLSVVHNGDISKHTELRSLLEDQNGYEQAKSLMEAYLNWFSGKAEKEILLMVAIIGRPVSLCDIKEICRIKPIVSLTENLSTLNTSQWKYAIKFLERLNLISLSISGDDTKLDCHPIVRDCLNDYLEKSLPGVWEEGHRVLFEYLKETEIKNTSDRSAIERTLRAIIHGNKAQMYDESFNLYHTKLKKGFTMLSMGSHLVDNDCLRTFFRDGWDDPVEELEEDSQYFLRSCVAANLVSLGRVREAISPAIRAIDFFVSQGMWVQATHAAGPLVSAMIEAGQLIEALKLLEKLMECVEKTESDIVKAMALNFEAYAKFLNGEMSVAEELFEEVERLIEAADSSTEINFPTISSYYCKFLLENGRPQDSFERSLKTAGWRSRDTWQISSDTTSVIASDYLVLGLAFMELGDNHHAKEYLDKQVDLFRAADDWLYLSTGLNSRARFLIRVGEFDKARSDLEESVDISKRTGARFGEWEAYLEFASLHLKMEDFTECERYLNLASSMEGMDSYKFRNSEIREMREALALDPPAPAQ